MIFLNLAMLLLLPSAFCQNSVPSKSPTTNLSEQERWNLDKYVWSHTHYKTSNADKPVIDFNALDNWLSLGDPNSNGLSISPNGKYFAYTIDRGDRWGYTNLDSLVLQSTTSSWRQSFAKVEPGFFSADNRQYIFLRGKTFYLLPLGGGKADSVNDVASYKMSANGEWVAIAINHLGVTTIHLQNFITKAERKFIDVKTFNFDKSGQWFYYESSDDHTTSRKELGVYNLNTGKDKSFLFDSYLFDEKGQALVKKQTIPIIVDNQKETRIEYINFRDFSVRTIWSSKDSAININKYSLNKSGKQVVINLSQNKQNSIWYWKEGMDSAVLKVNDLTEGIDKGLLIGEDALFSDNGNYIQFSLLPHKEVLQPIHDAVKVDVWSYKDSILQSDQPNLLKQLSAYTAILHLETNKAICLENQYEKVIKIQGDFAIVQKAQKDIYGGRFWEQGYNTGANWLVSLRDGSRKLLPTKVGKYSNSIWFSLGGQYLVYFDPQHYCHYFSYNLTTGKITDISTGLPDNQLVSVDPFLRTKEKSTWRAGIAAWIIGDQSLLVYDNNDIWQLDLAGVKPAFNLTNGFGFLHNTVFTLANGSRRLPNAPIVKASETLLLEGFNRESKYNGFYSKKLGIKKDPELLYMGPFLFHGSGAASPVSAMSPLKANKANLWILQRQTSTDAPNYFLTTDFKNFKRLTNLQPQKRYNWLTAELVSFEQLDGTMSQGVLYKPENFDSTRKYPVIIAFYAQLSDRLYQYPTPSYITAPLISEEPAWMVSHGYLIFIPDIYFTQGQWGPSTVNTLDGAAKYLGSLTYVDSSHIGAVGHSNSGRFGYYLLTHSHRFSAMCIGSGATDIISNALSFDPSVSKESPLEWAEKSSVGTGLGNLWENKDSWIDQTSVLHADNVSSPVLIYHCKRDGVPVSQAVEMFTSLWRLEKKAWWLQYDDGGHVLRRFKDVKDFTIRYTQFFDHYLKKAPAPRWMCMGIPYKYKEVESRYELDSTDSCANNCPICASINANK